MFIFYHRRGHLDFTSFRVTNEFATAPNVLPLSLSLSLSQDFCMFSEHPAYTGRSYFIIGVNAMDLTYFRLTNEFAVLRHVLPAS